MLDFEPSQRLIWGFGIFGLFVFQAISSIALFLYGVNRAQKDLISEHHVPEGSAILSSHHREWYFEKIRPFEDFFIRHNFTPNMLTCFGFVLSVLAAAFYHFHWIGAAGWIVLVAGTFDILDGTVARRTNRMSRSGAFFDSVLDRYAEMIIYMGLMSHYIQMQNFPMMWVVVGAIIGAQMVSYTRARAENAGVTGKVGIMQRPERFVYLGFGSLFSSHLNAAFSPWLQQKQYLLATTIMFIALMSNLTAARRFRSAFEELKKAVA